VLGYDTAMSTDHDWGPRALIFLRDVDSDPTNAIARALRESLPVELLGFSVGKSASTDQGAVDHRIRILTLREFVREQLTFDLDAPVEVADWLTFPAQNLLELTAGEVFHDGIGELSAQRARFAYYPRDVWLYLIAATWQRIGQEDHLMSRAGFAGDELGSAVIGSRLVRDAMNLAFLLERRYPPYPKWFGTAFSRLFCATELAPLLWRSQRATTWSEREATLCRAHEYLALRQNHVGLIEPVPTEASPFHDRPFRVIHAGEIAAAILRQIEDPEVKRIAEKRLIGGIDQITDNTDLREGMSEWRSRLRDLY
jgi:hypothetical protein